MLEFIVFMLVLIGSMMFWGQLLGSNKKTAQNTENKDSE